MGGCFTCPEGDFPPEGSRIRRRGSDLSADPAIAHPWITPSYLAEMPRFAEHCPGLKMPNSAF